MECSDGVQSGGNLRRPMNVHVEVFTDELTFYQLGSEVIHQFRVDEGLVDAVAKPLPSNAFQRAVWTLLENPESSLAARIIAILSNSGKSGQRKTRASKPTSKMEKRRGSRRKRADLLKKWINRNTKINDVVSDSGKLGQKHASFSPVSSKQRRR